MSVQLAPDVEDLIRQQIENGLYDDASDVVRAAMRLMEERDRRLRSLRAEVAKGLEQLERGEGVELTPERMELIWQRALANSRQGKPIKDAVKP